jgi:azurin
VKKLVMGGAKTETPGKPPVPGRFVRIELPRVGTLSLAEVQVFSAGKNIARSGKARQSSTEHSGSADRAIDGRTDGSYASGAQTHSREQEKNPWWEVDLGSEQPIESIVVWNRSADGESLAKRLDGFTCTILNTDRREVFSKAGIPAPPVKAEISVGAVDFAHAVRAAAIEAFVTIPSEQVGAFGALAGLVAQETQVPASARAIRLLPRSAWPAEQVAKVTPGLIAWARKVPDGARTAQNYLQTIQVADELAGTLPAPQATKVRRDLKDLRVAVYIVQTVREQMRFDTTRLIVEAGKPFQVIVQNTDFMPHNFVIVRPGTREKVGAVTETMKPDQVDSRGRAFVPRSRDVIAATRLLEAGQGETLQLTAPTEEGVYEFVCTFPGHWQVMWGQFVVTKDVDAYLEKNPQSIQPVASSHSHHE